MIKWADSPLAIGHRGTPQLPGSRPSVPPAAWPSGHSPFASRTHPFLSPTGSKSPVMLPRLLNCTFGGRPFLELAINREGSRGGLRVQHRKRIGVHGGCVRVASDPYSRLGAKHVSAGVLESRQNKRLDAAKNPMVSYDGKRSNGKSPACAIFELVIVTTKLGSGSSAQCFSAKAWSLRSRALGVVFLCRWGRGRPESTPFSSERAG